MTKAISTMGDCTAETHDWLPASFSCVKFGEAKDGKRLAVYIAGREDADVVLFNHSILTASRIWKDQAASALALGFRVICLDFRGHGASSAFQRLIRCK